MFTLFEFLPIYDLTINQTRSEQEYRLYIKPYSNRK